MLVHQIWGLMRILRLEKLLLCAGLLVQLLKQSFWQPLGLCGTRLLPGGSGTKSLLLLRSLFFPLNLLIPSVCFYSLFKNILKSSLLWKFSNIYKIEIIMWTLMYSSPCFNNFWKFYCVASFIPSKMSCNNLHLLVFTLWMSLSMLCQGWSVWPAKHSTGDEVLSSSVISFCLFILFMEFLRQKYWIGLPFPPPVDHILLEVFTMTHPSWVALHGMAHNFTELCKPLCHKKAVIHEGEVIKYTVVSSLAFYSHLDHWLGSASWHERSGTLEKPNTVCGFGGSIRWVRWEADSPAPDRDIPFVNITVFISER